MGLGRFCEFGGERQNQGAADGRMHSDPYSSAACCFRCSEVRQETKSRFAADEREGWGGGLSWWAWGCLRERRGIHLDATKRHVGSSTLRRQGGVIPLCPANVSRGRVSSRWHRRA